MKKLSLLFKNTPFVKHVKPKNEYIIIANPLNL